MDTKLCTGCNFVQSPSLKKREGKIERYLEIWRVVCVFIIFFISLSAPGVGWTEENFFQIINGNCTPVSPDFSSDRGYSVYVSYEGKKFP